MTTLTYLPPIPATVCPHIPACPAADDPGHDLAVTVYDHHADGGFVVLCNHVVLFDDTGELLPSGRVVPPHGPQPLHVDGTTLDAA